MATGPRGEKRPSDVIGCAMVVARLSVGDAVESLKVQSGKVRSGHAGAKARADALTAEQRSDIARKATGVMWG